jgi:hypothetical protein
LPARPDETNVDTVAAHEIALAFDSGDDASASEIHHPSMNAEAPDLSHPISVFSTLTVRPSDCCVDTEPFRPLSLEHCGHHQTQIGSDKRPSHHQTSSEF